MHRLRHLLITLTLFCPLIGTADDLSEEKKALIDELLSLTEPDDMAEIFTEVYVRSIAMALKQTRPDLDEKIYPMLRAEVSEVVKSEVGDGSVIHEMSYPIYHKYLTGSELEQLITFYKSPIGKKSLVVMPAISEEAILAGQAWGRGMGPLIQQRIFDLLQREGINIE